MDDQLLSTLLYIIPSIIVGVVAFLFFKGYIQNEVERRKFVIQKELQKESLPMRLQAYERLSLLLERISPNKLLTRVAPLSDKKDDYETLLIRNIEQEFEHNLTQQIYVTDNCWNIINASKNATIQLIRKASMSEKITNADKLREVILTEMMEKAAPSSAGLSYIKQEVSELW